MKMKIRPKYSIAALLLLMTCVGIGSAVFSRVYNSAQQQRIAVAGIRESHGEVAYDYYEPYDNYLPFEDDWKHPGCPGEPSWVASYLGIDTCHRVVTVRWLDDRAGLDAPTYLAQLNHVEYLRLPTYPQYPEPDWTKAIGKLHHLRCYEGPTDYLADIPEPEKLISISYDLHVERESEDADESVLARFPNLRCVRGTSPFVLGYISHPENLEELSISERVNHAFDLGRLSREQEEVLQRCVNLKKAALWLSDDEVACLSQANQLKRLDLRGVSGPGLADLPNSLEELELGCLSGYGARHLKAEEERLRTLKFLPALPNLTQMLIRCDEISDEDLVELKRLPKLSYLMIVSSNVTDKSIPLLTSLDTITRLDVVWCNISDDGMSELKSELPNAKVLTRPDY